jgi:hypothetical protein
MQLQHTLKKDLKVPVEVIVGEVQDVIEATA